MKSNFIFNLLAFTLCLSTIYSKCGPNTLFSKDQKCFCVTDYYGTEDQANTTGCIKCPNNTSSIHGNLGGVGNCKLCQHGFYVTKEARVGQEAYCTPCPDNKSTKDKTTFSSSSEGAKICTICKAGYYNSAEDIENQNTCVQCPDNSSTTEDLSMNTRSDEGLGSCDHCEFGFYFNEVIPGENRKCIKCPKNSTTSKKDSLFITSCKCEDPNAYLDNKINQCKCIERYEGLASVESPCKEKIEIVKIEENSSQNILKISFCFILLILTI